MLRPATVSGVQLCLWYLWCAHLQVTDPDMAIALPVQPVQVSRGTQTVRHRNYAPPLTQRQAMANQRHCSRISPVAADRGTVKTNVRQLKQASQFDADAQQLSN